MEEVMVRQSRPFTPQSLDHPKRGCPAVRCHLGKGIHPKAVAQVRTWHRQRCRTVHLSGIQEHNTCCQMYLREHNLAELKHPQASLMGTGPSCILESTQLHLLPELHLASRRNDMVASHSGYVLMEVLVELEELVEALGQPSSLQPRVLLRQEFPDL